MTADEPSGRPNWASQCAMAWVIDEAPVPATLFPVLMVVARRCDEHGRGSRQSVPTIAAKTGKSVDQVKRDIRELKKLGLLVPGDESLVAHFEPWKRPAVYDLPLHVSGQKPVKESRNKTGGTSQGGGMDAPPGMDATGWHSTRQGGGMDAPEGGGMDAPQTKPLNNPLKQPSSLSSGFEEASAPNVPAPRAERETVDASQKELQPQPLDPVHGLLVAAGCPPEKLNEVKAHIQVEFHPQSNAWWRKVAGNGDLPGIVADALQAPTLAVPVMSNSAWIATLTDEPVCQHGTAGGNLQRDGDGWLACAFCRIQSGWSAKDHQDRTESRGAGGRSTSAVRAEQGLRVAAELDNLSPADRRVCDSQPLYGHHKALEGRNSKHVPYRNPPVEAYEPL